MKTFRTPRSLGALAVATLLAGPPAALAQTGQGGTGATNPTPTNPAMPSLQGATPTNNNATADSRLDRADRNFIERAAHNGHAEVEASKLALTKAKSPEVRAFAEQMVKDHTQANQELAALARARGVTPPDEPSLVQKGKQKLLLDTADGDDFDRRYAESMGLEGHQDTIELFEKASREVKDPELRAFATNKLPALRHHMDMARKLPQNAGKKP